MKTSCKWLKLITTLIAMTMVMTIFQAPLLADSMDSTTYTIKATQTSEDTPWLMGFNYPTTAKEGQKVRINFMLWDDVTFNGVTVNDKVIKDYAVDTDTYIVSDVITPYYVEFTMPAENVEFTFNVTLPTYKVILDDCENGKAELNMSSAKPGDTVTLTVTPDEGYEVDTIVTRCVRFNEKSVFEDELTEYWGNDETEYPIYMDHGDTTVTVTFKPSSIPTLTSGVAHVQDIGNVTSYAEEEGLLYLGTEGQGKRLESITLNFENPTNYSGTLEYRVHVQDLGWTDWVTAGKPAGTEGMGKRIEAIEIRLTGELAEYYSVSYCVHIQDYGYMQGFVQDGALAGTTGESKRIESLIVYIGLKDGYGPSVNYRVHVQDLGWESTYASDGKMAGTSGQSKRLEGIEIFLSSSPYSGGIQYKTHVQDYGWETSWTKNGEMSGTQGEAKRLEGICIELYGEVADYYDIYYRVHAQDIGWMGWAKNGECAGTAGRSARLEGIQIVLVPKGSPAPSATYEGITAVTEQAFIEGF